MAFRAKWPFERESDIYLVAIEDNMAKAGFYTSNDICQIEAPSRKKARRKDLPG